MQYVIGGVICYAVFAAFLVRFFREVHTMDEEMSEMLAEDIKMQHLLNEVTARYPQESIFDSVLFYLNDIEREIIVLKQNSNIILITPQLKKLFEEKRLLQQERNYLERLDTEMKCDFNLLTSARA